MVMFSDFLGMFWAITSWDITRAVYIAMVIITIFGIIRMVTHND